MIDFPNLPVRFLFLFDLTLFKLKLQLKFCSIHFVDIGRFFFSFFLFVFFSNSAQSHSSCVGIFGEALVVTEILQHKFIMRNSHTIIPALEHQVFVFLCHNKKRKTEKETVGKNGFLHSHTHAHKRIHF